MKNEGQKHGLFSNIYNSDTLEINTKVNNVMELVRRKSYEKKNIYNAVISFNPENALLTVGDPVTKDAWEELVNQQLRIIAEGNGIKMSNFRWKYMKKAEVDIANIILKYITKFIDKNKEVFSNYREIYKAKQLLNEIFKLLGRSGTMLYGLPAKVNGTGRLRPRAFIPLVTQKSLVYHLHKFSGCSCVEGCIE
jgi:hypothetical protein